MKLDGGVALVTGAASGMGRATARRLTDEGMKVCALDISADALQAVAEPLGALPIVCDVSDAEQVDAAFEACLDTFGQLDLAHLNAGVSLKWSGDIAELDLNEYQRAIAVNQHQIRGHPFADPTGVIDSE